MGGDRTKTPKLQVSNQNATGDQVTKVPPPKTKIKPSSTLKKMKNQMPQPKKPARGTKRNLHTIDNY
jgi:hypothetical protein